MGGDPCCWPVAARMQTACARRSRPGGCRNKVAECDFSILSAAGQAVHESVTQLYDGQDDTIDAWRSSDSDSDSKQPASPSQPASQLASVQEGTAAMSYDETTRVPIPAGLVTRLPLYSRLGPRPRHYSGCASSEARSQLYALGR